MVFKTLGKWARFPENTEFLIVRTYEVECAISGRGVDKVDVQMEEIGKIGEEVEFMFGSKGGKVVDF